MDVGSMGSRWEIQEGSDLSYSSDEWISAKTLSSEQLDDGVDLRCNY